MTNTLGNVVAVIVGASALALSSAAWASADAGNKACLECHADDPAARKNLIYIDPFVFAASVHGKLHCIDCHQDARESNNNPHPRDLAEVNCTGCHYKGNPEGAPNFTPMQEYKTSVHGLASLERGDQDVATCSACHGKHNIRPASDPESTIYRVNIPRTCAVCHDNMQMVLKHNIHAEQPYHEYEQSVHGKALFTDGMVEMAAVCTDCHGVHDIQANTAADLKPHQPATCGKCHQKEYNAYSRSIHGEAFKQGIVDVPVCSDCHGEHTIAAPWNPESTVSAFNVTYTCAGCHDDVTRMSKYNILTDRVSTFKQSDHGVGNDLGIVSVATCVSCHGYHEILPASDPTSSISRASLEKTCGKSNCHPNPTPEIMSKKIHVDTRDQNFQNLRRIRTLMLWALCAVAGFAVAAGLLAFALRLRQNFEHRAAPHEEK